MAIKECSGCDTPAVGRVVPDPERAIPNYEQLVCATCAKALMADGVAVALLEPRLDLVERVRLALQKRLYDDDTYEGALALNLAVDKLGARALQRELLPQCPWEGTPCALDKCKARCFLDTRYAQLTGAADADPDERCGVFAVPEAKESIRCDQAKGHASPEHSNGWGRMITKWCDPEYCSACAGLRCWDVPDVGVACACECHDAALARGARPAQVW